MSAGVSLAAAGPALTAWAALINAAGNQQRLELYACDRPAAAGGVPDEPAVVSVPISTGAASVVGDELLIAGPGPSVLTVDAGTPVWARLFGGGGLALFDFDARLSTAPDAGEQVVVDAPVLAAGAVVRVSLGAIRLPG